MALGFANVSTAISTRYNLNLDDKLREKYDLIIKSNKIKSEYEKFALLNILSFEGYGVFKPMCKRTKKAFNNLLNKGIIEIYDDFYVLK